MSNHHPKGTAMKKKTALLAAGLAGSLAAAVMGIGVASANGATTNQHSPDPSVQRTITGWLVTPHLGF